MTEILLTDAQAAEIRKCMDLDYFAALLGSGPIKSKFEERMVQNVSRQDALIFTLHDSTFGGDYKMIAILEHCHDQAVKSMAIIKELLAKLPEYMLILFSIRRTTQTELVFDNDSRICVKKGSCWAQGLSLSHVLISTLAYEDEKQKANIQRDILFAMSFMQESKVIYFS
jgi:hypothetical protein